MIHPEDFGGPFGILARAFLISAIIYGALGFVGFIKYGDNVEPTITLNLPKKSQ